MTSFDLQELVRPELAELRPYLPHGGEYAVRLDANEAPPLLSAEGRRRLAEVAARTAWERYPDATHRELRAALAKRCGVTPDQILVGVGSDEIITLLLTALTRPKAGAEEAVVLTTAPTFVMYRASARARGLSVVEVPLDDAWDLDEAAMLGALERVQPNVVFIASPNNPTGTLMDRGRLTRCIEAARRSLVVVDEAYIDYADRNQLDLLQRFDNVAILRTLSKIGFAALRIGWLVGSPALVSELDKIRLPYNLPTPCQAMATVALTELHAEIDATCQQVVRERELLRSALAELPGVRFSASQANFLWFETERDGRELFEALGARGILVRSFHGRGGRLDRYLRVTVGAPEENRRFLEALRGALKG